VNWRARLKLLGLSAIGLVTPALLTGCDGSQPFALRDGCYYDDDGYPIIRVHGEEGVIMTPPPPAPSVRGHVSRMVHRVHLRARQDRNGAYVEVTPSFYLLDSHEAATSSDTTTRFAIDTRERPPAIMVHMETWGETPVRLGRPC